MFGHYWRYIVKSYVHVLMDVLIIMGIDTLSGETALSKLFMLLCEKGLGKQKT